MITKKISGLRFLLLFPLSAMVLSLLCMTGCREPLLKDTGPPQTDLEFDASVSDAGTGALCGNDPANIFNNDYNPYFGGDDALDVVVVHFSNFSCSHCAVFAKDTKELWEKRLDFQKRVRIYFHHFPFSSDFNWQQHQFVVAAGNQGMENFWALHDFIYDGSLEGKYYSIDDLRSYVQDTLHLDMLQFDADFEAEETKAFLKWDLSQGELAGVQGTPTVFLCGKRVSDRRALEEEIDNILNPDS